LYVTIRPLDFRGLKNIWERDFASKFETFRDAKTQSFMQNLSPYKKK